MLQPPCSFCVLIVIFGPSLNGPCSVYGMWAWPPRNLCRAGGSGNKYPLTYCLPCFCPVLFSPFSWIPSQWATLCKMQGNRDNLGRQITPPLPVQVKKGFRLFSCNLSHGHTPFWAIYCANNQVTSDYYLCLLKFQLFHKEEGLSFICHL